MQKIGEGPANQVTYVQKETLGPLDAGMTRQDFVTAQNKAKLYYEYYAAQQPQPGLRTEGNQVLVNSQLIAVIVIPQKGYFISSYPYGQRKDEIRDQGATKAKLLYDALGNTAARNRPHVEDGAMYQAAISLDYGTTATRFPANTQIAIWGRKGGEPGAANCDFVWANDAKTEVKPKTREVHGETQVVPAHEIRPCGETDGAVRNPSCATVLAALHVGTY